MSPLNKYFSIDDLIGTVVTENEFQCLMAAGKIYTTTCRMTGDEAAKAMGKDLSEFALEERSYGGQIVADSLKEAEAIAIQRGFGEEVEGVLCGVIPYDSNIINPCDTINQLN